MRVSTLAAILAIAVAAMDPSGANSSVVVPPPEVPQTAAAGIPMPARPDVALNKPTNEGLDKQIEMVSLHETALGQALDQFARDAHVSLSVNWKALEDAGIPRHTPVNVELSQIPARKALDVIVAMVGGGNGSLHYIVHDNEVVVSTKDDLQSAQYQRVLIYDLRPLFADVELDSPQAVEGANALVETIMTVVAPDSWADSGGTVGRAKVLNGQLIINQTLENHDQIAVLLQELTKTPARPTRSYDVRDLIKEDPTTKVTALIAAVQASCGRETWRGQGGKSSTIAFFDGKLYVTTTPAVHDQIENLLKMMHP